MAEEIKDKFFQIEFDYSGSGFIRCRADSPEQAVEILHGLISDRGGQVDNIIEVKEVSQLMPEGMEPEKMN